MKVSTVAGSIVLAGVAFVGASWYTGNIYADQQQVLLDEANDQYPQGLSLVYSSVEAGIFSRVDKLTVVIEPEYIQQLDSEFVTDKTLKIDLLQTCSVKPLMLNCESRISSEDPDLVEFAQYMPEYSILGDFNMWNDSQHWSITTEGSKFEIEGSMVELQPSSLFMSGDVDGDKIDYSGSWKGVTISEPELEVAMGELSFSGYSEKRDSVYLLGESEMKINGIEVTDAGDQAFSMGLTDIYAAVTENEDKTVAVRYKLASEFIKGDMEGQMFDLKNVVSDLLIPSLDGDLIVEMQQLNGEGEPDMEKVMALVDKAGKNGVTVELTEMKATYNNVDMQSNGQFDVASFSAQDLQMHPGIQGKMSGNLMLNLGANITDIFPDLTDSLAQLEQGEMVTRDEGGNYTVELALSEGLVTANGKPLQRIY